MSFLIGEGHGDTTLALLSVFLGAKGLLMGVFTGDLFSLNIISSSLSLSSNAVLLDASELLLCAFTGDFSLNTISSSLSLSSNVVALSFSNNSLRAGVSGFELRFSFSLRRFLGGEAPNSFGNSFSRSAFRLGVAVRLRPRLLGERSKGKPGKKRSLELILFTHWGRDKWLPISWQYFQMRFLEWEYIRFHWSLFPRVLFKNIPALVEIMAWRRPCDKPLSEPKVA